MITNKKMEHSGNFFKDLLFNDYSAKKIGEFSEKLENSKQIPIIHFSESNDLDNLVVYLGNGMPLTIKAILDSIHYPLNRGPYFYASEYEINYSHKTFIIFVQDGLIIEDPDQKELFKLFLWTYWKEVRFTKHIQIEAPVILLAFPDNDAVHEISISPRLDLRKNLKTLQEGSSVHKLTYNDEILAEIKFAFSILKRFWMVVDQNRTSYSSNIPLDILFVLNKKDFEIFREAIKTSPDKLKMDNEADGDIEEEDEIGEEDEKGLPLIQSKIKKNKDGTMDEQHYAMVMKYLSNHLCPTEAYNRRLGIGSRIPTWIEKIDNDNCCPKFSEDEINFINNKILNDKIIPVLKYAPDEFLDHTKQVWWILPFSIFNAAGKSVASWVFIDKNGFYMPFSDDDENDVTFVIPWQDIKSIEYVSEEYYTDEPEVQYLEIFFDVEQNQGVSFVEFVPEGRGSYLSVISNIYEIRKKTIKASEGAAIWYEGVGGEGFQSFEVPSDLLIEAKWKNTERPDPKFFGFNEETLLDNQTEIHKQKTEEDIKAALNRLEKEKEKEAGGKGIQTSEVPSDRLIEEKWKNPKSPDPTFVEKKEETKNEENTETGHLQKANQPDKDNSIQDQIMLKWLMIYPQAVVKKINTDTFMDIHMTEIHPKRGTHIWFNTPNRGGLRVGFFCRDVLFLKPVIDKNGDKLEVYSNGVILKGNPIFNTIEDVLIAGQKLVKLLKI